MGEEGNCTGGDGHRGRWGKGELYLTLHCHHHSDSSIQMGSGESHFRVSFTVRDKVTRQGRAVEESNHGSCAYQQNASPLTCSSSSYKGLSVKQTYTVICSSE